MSSTRPTLIHLGYSPWSEKARWALEHHRIDYRSVPYLPMLGAWGLRLRLRRFRGPVTVPVLFAEDGPYDDSWRIAEYADRVGKAETLLPPADLDEIVRWNQQSEIALSAGRALVTARVLQDAEALKESLPPAVPAFLRAVGRPIAAMGARYLMRKYDLSGKSEASWRDDLRQPLLALRDALQNRETLLDRFSYADIAGVSMLVFVTPPAEKYISLGPASRRCWCDGDLAGAFADLLAWRDRTLATYR